MKQFLPVLHLIICITFSELAFSQEITKCKASLHNDTLSIENGLVCENFRWNNGNLIRLSFGPMSGSSVIMPDDKPVFESTSGANQKGNLKVTEQAASPVSPACLRVEVSCTLGKLSIRRVFRVVPMSPAIACELWFRGELPGGREANVNQGDLKNIENEAARRQGESMIAVSDRIKLQGPHWSARAVEFFDITDRNNTLVQVYDRLAYRQECHLRGNLLLLKNSVSGTRFFLLKEAPASSVQLYYPGFDFTLKQGEVKVAGLGVAAGDISDSVWVRGYGTVTGLSGSGDELGILTALRKYQESIRLHKPGRDDMILMNTWGDRSQDSRVNEKFSLAELDAGHRVGITHLQLDDGWQTGRSANSAQKGGSFENIWRNSEYWKPDPVKFPSGLGPVIKKGKELGIEICLWFNPSPDKSNSNWEKDAGALIQLNKEYGIRTFKIDGVKLDDKLSEINFRKMLDKVVEATGGNVVFNLDVTAGRRGGYNLFNEYGNLFLENRYTDWKNYYPFWTLRNLWMLSRYIPAQNLQMEFLNIRRNKQNYPDDPFGPDNYSFDYVFAVTMMAQPLAWFEGTGLPEEAFKSGELIRRYRDLQSDIHKGIILPVGEEPDGVSWTGFQSLQGKSGYFLVFRESDKNDTGSVKTWLKPGMKVSCDLLTGSGKSFKTTVENNGYIPFILDKPNSFALYRYSIE